MALKKWFYHKHVLYVVSTSWYIHVQLVKCIITFFYRLSLGCPAITTINNNAINNNGS